MFEALLFSAVSAHAVVAKKFDPPDLEREARMHQTFRGDPVSLPSPLAPDAYAETYRINQGDTLWSLSRLLYGDGNYWPRVWSQNHAITNPHLVREGHSLQLLLGSEDDAPAFRFSEEGGDPGVELAAASGGSGMIEIPPPELTPRPVLKLPNSFPEWQNLYRRVPKAMIDDRGLLLRRAAAISRVYLRGWVDEAPPEEIGTMLENDTEAGLPVVNQYVYVKIKRGVASAGKKVLIAQTKGKLKRVTATFEDDRDAYLVQVSGEIELTEQVENTFTKSRDKENFETWRALITKATGLSVKDSSLIDGELAFADVSPKGPAGAGTAQIIGSERNVSSVLYGAGDLIFLDRGTDAGVNLGEIYDIFSDRRSRHNNTPVVYSPAPSGRLKIVRVSDKLATAVVLEAHDSILQGDRIRQLARRQDDQERLAPIELEPTRSQNKEIKADGIDDPLGIDQEINEAF